MAKEIIQGRNVVLSINDIVVGCANSGSFSSEFEMVDAACVETGNFYSGVPGRLSASLSLEGIVIVDTPTDATAMRAHDIETLHLDQTLIDWKFGTATVGHQALVGQGYISSYEKSGEVDGVATYSAEITVVDSYGTLANA